MSETPERPNEQRKAHSPSQQSPDDIFQQHPAGWTGEGSSLDRGSITPEEAGIEIQQRPGQTSTRVEVRGDDFAVGPESERRTLELRDKRPLKRAETR